jgi:hypothetical protein
VAARRDVHAGSSFSSPRGFCYKVEREEVAPPSEATIVRLAEALHEDPDVLLALAGKVSADQQRV